MITRRSLVKAFKTKETGIAIDATKRIDSDRAENTLLPRYRADATEIPLNYHNVDRVDWSQA